MKTSIASQSRRISQAVRKSTNPSAAVLNTSVASRGSIGGDIEFAETAAIGIERDGGASREIEVEFAVARVEDRAVMIAGEFERGDEFGERSSRWSNESE